MPDSAAHDSSNLLVPASAADITARWLREALPSAFPGETISEVTVEPVGQEYGLASQLFRCRWDAGPGVVVKLWDTSGPAGTREVPFYRTFGKELDASIPKCYHAALDAGRARGVLVLEEIRDAVQGDDLEPLSLPLAEAVARELAGMHGRWLDHAALHEAAWLPSVAKWERGAEWFAERRALFLERFGDRLDARARAVLDRIEGAQSIANARLADAPITLLHEDLHLDNIVFAGGVEPVILDWARCSQGPLSLDLYELVFRMSRAADREQVLAAYLDQFAACTGEAPEPAEIRYQLGGAFLRKFALATCGIARWQPATPREAALIDVALSRAWAALDYWFTRDPGLFAFV